MAQTCLGRGVVRGFTHQTTLQVEPKGMSKPLVMTLVLGTMFFWTTREMRADAPQDPGSLSLWCTLVQHCAAACSTRVVVQLQNLVTVCLAQVVAKENTSTHQPCTVTFLASNMEQTLDGESAQRQTFA